ncbi:hypothetical protein ACVLVH_004704 [Kluyvera sp. 1366]
MKMTVSDITEAMHTSHEGYAELVADSVSFSLGRPLTHEEHDQIYHITECAISEAVKKLETSEPEADQVFTLEQFSDLADYLYRCGQFCGPGGIQGQDFQSLTVIDEPTDEPEGRKIYIRDGYPIAVYDFDTGYTVLRT